jgi:hypothetical protein
MLTIITPSCRQGNLPKLHDSINFDKIEKWIIVYDTSKNRKYKRLYEGNPKILEVDHNEIGVAGHPQRNCGIELVGDGYIYFLDDDNIIHQDFWLVVDKLDGDHFYTFDMYRPHEKQKMLYGNNIMVKQIDTAMFIVHKKHIGNIKWIKNLYSADGHFISAILQKNRESHIYINIIGAYYNFLRR